MHDCAATLVSSLIGSGQRRATSCTTSSDTSRTFSREARPNASVVLPTPWLPMKATLQRGSPGTAHILSGVNSAALRLPLHTRMLIGGVVGAGGGVLAYFLAGDSPLLAGFVKYVTQPVGQVFLRLLFMLVLPLIFAALALGVAGL